MQLLTYVPPGTTEVRHGVRDGEEVVDLGAGDLTTVLARPPGASPPGAPTGARRHRMDRVRVLAPLLRPTKVLAAAANYQDHVTEGGGPPLDKSRLAPRLFLKPATSVVGPDAEVALPELGHDLDWEAELAVVIGSGGRGIAVERALDHVFGYCCANDLSARSMDHGFDRDPGAAVDYFDWLAGKWGDGFAPLGPWLVTADEVADPQRLALGLELNGETRQDGSTADMIFSVAELIAHASRLCTLEPGDVLLTGTPAGTGAASGRFLGAGDVVTARVEGLGELTTRIVA